MAEVKEHSEGEGGKPPVLLGGIAACLGALLLCAAIGGIQRHVWPISPQIRNQSDSINSCLQSKLGQQWQVSVHNNAVARVTVAERALVNDGGPLDEGEDYQRLIVVVPSGQKTPETVVTFGAYSVNTGDVVYTRHSDNQLTPPEREIAAAGVACIAQGSHMNSGPQ